MKRVSCIFLMLFLGTSLPCFLHAEKNLSKQSDRQDEPSDKDAICVALDYHEKPNYILLFGSCLACFAAELMLGAHRSFESRSSRTSDDSIKQTFSPEIVEYCCQIFSFLCQQKILLDTVSVCEIFKIIRTVEPDNVWLEEREIKYSLNNQDYSLLAQNKA